MSQAKFYDYKRLIRGANQFFQLLQCDCINGYGIALKRVDGKITEGLCIVVYVSRKLPLRNIPIVNRIPSRLVLPDDRAKDGVLEFVTDVMEAKFFASPDGAKYRPAPGGVSIGHVDITAGTLGGLVHDLDTNTRVILSNNHVLANSNEALAGDPILQPGPADGGTLSADLIAELTRWIDINFDTNGTNIVDAAIATPLDQSDVVWDTITIGKQTPRSMRIVDEKDVLNKLVVQKRGRTTLHTQGFVQAVHATAQVKYSLFQKANFVDQIIISQDAGKPDFSAGGDSGSLIYDMDANCVGLLFAGSPSSPTEVGTTIANPIRNVFRALHLRLLK